MLHSGSAEETIQKYASVHGDVGGGSSGEDPLATGEGLTTAVDEMDPLVCTEVLEDILTESANQDARKGLATVTVRDSRGGGLKRGRKPPPWKEQGRTGGR